MVEKLRTGSGASAEEITEAAAALVLLRLEPSSALAAGRLAKLVEPCG